MVKSGAPPAAVPVETAAITCLPVQKFTAGGPHANTTVATVDTIAIEEPLEISLAFGPPDNRRRETMAVTMRTPGNDSELAAGLLFSDGTIPDPDAIATTTIESPNQILITLKDGISPRIDTIQRRSYTNSSCGVCSLPSIASLDYLRRTCDSAGGVPESGSHPTVDAALLYALPAALKGQQNIFNATGGLHAAALFDGTGNLLAVREDIGRHNALDKLVGFAGARRMLPLNGYILLLSGRACFELLQKAAMAGIGMVVAIGPPSSLAIRLAEEAGITLIGFLRENRFNLYTGGHRLRNFQEK